MTNVGATAGPHRRLRAAITKVSRGAAWLGDRFRRLGPHRGPAVAFAILFVVGTRLFFTLDFYGRPAARIGGDGHYYFAYLVSAWKDHDLDFANQYAGKDFCINLFHYGVTRTGRPANPFSVGPALLWTPFFAVADVAAHVERLFRPATSVDGLSTLYQRVTLYGTFLYGFAALLLAYRIACRRTRPALACLAACGAFLGGATAWYAVGQPSCCHAQGAFCAALFFELWDPLRRRRDGDVPTPSWALCVGLGLLLGLAADVRAQEVALCLLPVVDAAVRYGRRRSLVALRDEVTRLAVVAAVATVAFLPQMIAWKVLYGRLLTVPQGGTFMHWSDPQILAPLFSTRAGSLFPYAPAWWVAAFVGGPLWLRRRERAALAALLVAATAVYVNGAASDWWGGLGFGGRRYADLTVFVAIALGVVLDAVARLVERNPTRAAYAGLAAAVGLPVLWTLGLLGAWQQDALYDPHGLPWPAVSAVAAGEVAASVEQRVGDPLAWPASWWFALRHHTDLGRFDVVAGSDLEPGTARAPRMFELFTTAGRRFVARGFGDNPEWYDNPGVKPASTLRVERSPACLTLPFNDAYDLRVELRITAEGHPGRIALDFDGHDLGTFTVGPVAAFYGGAVTRADMHRGTNDLCLRAIDPLEAMGLDVDRIRLATSK